MTTKLKKNRNMRKQQKLSADNDNTPQTEELEQFKNSLEALIPEDDPKASFQVVRFLIQHRHEFSALDQAMSETLKNEEKRRQSLVDVVNASMTTIVRGYTSREAWKVALAGVYILGAVFGGLWLIVAQKEFTLGTGLLASPFIGTVLQQMFKK